jgi:dTDP-4-dehydrorhamnose reductase
MKILLIGVTGQLGSDLIRTNPGHRIIAPARSELDVTQGNVAAEVITNLRPDVVINTAAFHNVPLCEQEPDQAFRVNCIAVRDLARACCAVNSWLITISTDYVFNGEKCSPYVENDCPAPLQMYGISKLAGERAALAVAPARTIVIRTCGLYGQSGARSKSGNFVDNRVADGRRGTAIEMSCDQTVCPTSTSDLSRAIYDLVVHPELTPGVYHLVNEGACTWYEFTKAIYRYFHFTGELHEIDLGGRSGAIRRPLYSVLANNRARSLGIKMPTWRDALRSYLQSKYPL